MHHKPLHVCILFMCVICITLPSQLYHTNSMPELASFHTDDCHSGISVPMMSREDMQEADRAFRMKIDDMN